MDKGSQISNLNLNLFFLFLLNFLSFVFFPENVKYDSSKRKQEVKTGHVRY